MDASVPSAVGDARCARSVWLTTPHFAARCCTALLIKPEPRPKAMPLLPGYRIDASQRGEYKFSFNLAFLFCAVVIKWPDEDISGYEQISRSTNPPLAPVRRIPGAFAWWMRWHLLR